MTDATRQFGLKRSSLRQTSPRRPATRALALAERPDSAGGASESGGATTAVTAVCCGAMLAAVDVRRGTLSEAPPHAGSSVVASGGDLYARFKALEKLLKFLEIRSAIAVQDYDFAINNCCVNGKGSRSNGEIRELAGPVLPVPAPESHLAAIEMA